MIVYEATKQSFLEDVYNDQVAKKIKARLGFNVGRKKYWICGVWNYCKNKDRYSKSYGKNIKR